MKYDFSGWATRTNVRYADGRTILTDAFKDNDGQTVPLVWNHQHDKPDNVLGHARLENRKEGVYAYCSFNDTPLAQAAKASVEHGDIKALSIYANQLKQKGRFVEHGTIREVSLVMASANPEAYIESVLRHSADGGAEEAEDEAVIYNGEALELFHAEEATNGGDGDDETLKDIFDSLSEKQKNLFFYMADSIAEGEEDGDDNDEPKGGNDEMKHNVFDKGTEKAETVLSHAAQGEIIGLAKTSSVGSLKQAINIYMEEHSDTLAHGIESIEQLFPEYEDVRPGAPALLTTDQGWIGKVLSKVHKSPISRIRTRQADLRNIEELRARGYQKGKEKKHIGNFRLLHRTTDPQTVYVKSKIDRDDIIDITDFDTVNYLYGIDRMNLNEELATAIMLGDSREDGAEGKIYPDKIRPIWTDDELYTIHADVDIARMKRELQGTNTGANFGENYIYAEAVIQSLLYAREDYKGSGSPDFFCTPHLLNIMLLARDLNGRRIYETVESLRAALNVNEIITAEQFAGKIRTVAGKKKKLMGLMCNLSDYNLGATKGGQITHFTDFDIDFNQEKSLLETRCSSANTRVLSAIALEEDVTEAAGGES